MQDIIDAFAHEYGWSKRQTLEEIYPEEAPILIKRITERRKNEVLDRISDWSMLLDIVTAPHTKGGEGVRRVSADLQRMRRAIQMGTKAKTPEADIEFHRGLVDLNRRRRERAG